MKNREISWKVLQRLSFEMLWKIVQICHFHVKLRASYSCFLQSDVPGRLRATTPGPFPRSPSSHLEKKVRFQHLSKLVSVDAMALSDSAHKVYPARKPSEALNQRQTPTGKMEESPFYPSRRGDARRFMHCLHSIKVAGFSRYREKVKGPAVSTKMSTNSVLIVPIG